MTPSGYLFNVYFLLKPRPPQKGDYYEVICSFEEDYAAFMAPLFDGMDEEAGRTIVFINGATFGGSDLKLLAQMTAVARKRMAVKEESWRYCAATRCFPKAKDKAHTGRTSIPK